MKPAKIHILKQHLAPGEMNLLRKVTDDLTVDPFHYCRHTGEYEPDEDWSLRQEEFSDEVIDLMLKCCDILSQHEELAADEPEERDSGDFTLNFVFVEEAFGSEADSLEVGEEFLRQLRNSPGYRIEERPIVGGREVSVTFSFTSDFDFYRQKSDIYWLLQLARRKVGEEPYEGSRV